MSSLPGESSEAASRRILQRSGQISHGLRRRQPLFKSGLTFVEKLVLNVSQMSPLQKMVCALACYFTTLLLQQPTPQALRVMQCMHPLVLALLAGNLAYMSYQRADIHHSRLLFYSGIGFTLSTVCLVLHLILVLLAPEFGRRVRVVQDYTVFSVLFLMGVLLFLIALPVNTYKEKVEEADEFELPV